MCICVALIVSSRRCWLKLKTSTSKNTATTAECDLRAAIECLTDFPLLWSLFKGVCLQQMRFAATFLNMLGSRRKKAKQNSLPDL